MGQSEGQSDRIEAEDHAPEVREPAGYRRSDAEVVTEIRQRLADDVGLDAKGIEVEVKDGEVTLCGGVRCPADAQRAEAHACTVPGARLVRNELLARTAPAPDMGQPVGAAAKMGKPGYER